MNPTETSCIKLIDYTKKSWMLHTQKKEEAGKQEVKGMVNLGSFLAISELIFSKTMGNKDALKKGLMKHIF